MYRMVLASTLLITALGVGLCARAEGQDAAALEDQYKTCAKHYIPAEKCTDIIYKQLKYNDIANAAIDEPDSNTVTALKAVREYQRKLKNPASMQVRTAYITDKGLVCLDISAQNGFGGHTVSRVVFIPNYANKKNKDMWFDEGGFGGSLSSKDSGGVDRWPGLCTAQLSGKLKPGTDITDKVNRALTAGN